MKEKTKTSYITKYKYSKLNIQNKTKEIHLKRNKIVASHNSLRYCQCDIRRRKTQKTKTLKNKQIQQPIFHASSRNITPDKRRILKTYVR
jgi:hypothetical protein